MRILSWNINGTRRILRNYQNCDDMLRSLDADIVCVQGAFRDGEMTLSDAIHDRDQDAEGGC